MIVAGDVTADQVEALVNDFIMPIIAAIGPDPTAWKTKVTPGPIPFAYGDFASVLLNFVIIGFVCWRLTKFFIKEPKSDPKPATQECPYCRQTIDARAVRCAFCTSELKRAA